MGVKKVGEKYRCNASKLASRSQTNHLGHYLGISYNQVAEELTLSSDACWTAQQTLDTGFKER